MAIEDLTEEEIAYLLRQQGMGLASGNPFSTSGGFAPELTDFAYDVPSMLGGIPISTNSKGEPNPYNVESQAKRLNFAQDQLGSGGLGSNMIAMMTGGQGTDPSAWTPTRVGVGNPLQFQNLNVISALAESGGSDWQTFVARELLGANDGVPKSPAAAITKLKQFVRGENGVSAASPEFLASLDYNADFEPTGAGRDLDPTNDRDFATMYDIKGMTAQANKMFEGLANDKALQSTAHYDEKTGQYYSGFEDKKTEQMEAADKLGLAYPTQSYADDDYIKEFQRRTLGSDDTYDQANAQGRQAEAAAARDATASKASDEQNYMTAVRRAYEANHPTYANSASGGPATVTPGPPAGTSLGAFVGPNAGGASAPALGDEMVNVQTGMRLKPGRPNTGLDMIYNQTHINEAYEPVMQMIARGDLTPEQVRSMGLASGSVKPSSKPVTATGLPDYVTPPEEQAGAVGLPGYVIPDTGPSGSEKPKTKAKAPKNVKELGAGFALGSLTGPGRKELDEATRRKTKANQAASEAQQAYYKAGYITDDEMERAKVGDVMRLLAHQGRTPMQDQLSARSQTLRNLIGY